MKSDEYAACVYIEVGVFLLVKADPTFFPVLHAISLHKGVANGITPLVRMGKLLFAFYYDTGS
ncbi:hypothetical protein DXB41_07720 [Segatella copri]|nr:hypothetical protein DXB41_07720 [Segatella copri]